MAIILASLKANLAREASGDWVEFPDWPGVEFNVSSLLLPAYRIERDLMAQRLARRHKGKPVPPNEMTTELGKLHERFCSK